MTFPPYHDTPDIVIAATRWLIQRHRTTGCPGVARLVAQHLDWLAAHADKPYLVDACQRLAREWHTSLPSRFTITPPVRH